MKVSPTLEFYPAAILFLAKRKPIAPQVIKEDKMVNIILNTLIITECIITGFLIWLYDPYA